MSVLRGEEPRHRSGVAAQARHVRLPHGISRNCPTKSSSLLLAVRWWERPFVQPRRHGCKLLSHLRKRTIALMHDIAGSIRNVILD